MHPYTGNYIEHIDSTTNIILFLKHFLPCKRTILLCKEVVPKGIEYGNTPILTLYFRYHTSTKQHLYLKNN